jgi:hypothetical protein
MDFEALICFGVWLSLALFGIAFVVRRGLAKRLGVGWYPNTEGLGTALMVLQAYTQPRVQHVIQQMMDEDVDEDEAGGPDDPVVHLHRQAKRLRQGRLVGPLTARVYR